MSVRKTNTWADDSDDENEIVPKKPIVIVPVPIPDNTVKKQANLIFSNWNSAIKDIDGSVPINGLNTTVFSKDIRKLVDDKKWRFSKWYGLQGGKKQKSNKKSRFVQFLYWYQTDKQREQFLYDLENGINNDYVKSYYVYYDPSLETSVKKKVVNRSSQPATSKGKRPWEKIKA